MKNKIDQYAIGNWESLLPGRQVPQGLSSLVISQPHGRDYEKGKITQIIFANGEDEPVLVAKFCKSKKYEHSLRKEAEIIRDLQARGLKGYIPEVVGMAEVEERAVLFQRPVEDSPLSLQIKELAFREGWDSTALQALVLRYFGLAAQFLGKLVLEENSLIITAEAINKNIEPVVSAYVTGLNIDGQEKYSCYKTLELFGRLMGRKITGRLAHGDFIPSNLFLDEDGSHLIAIDWELAGKGGLFFLDAFRFLYYCYEDIVKTIVREEDLDSHFIETFVNKKNWYGNLAFEFYKSVLGEFGTVYEDYKRLLVLFLMHEYSLQSRMARFPSIHHVSSIRRRVNFLNNNSKTPDFELRPCDIIVPVFNALADLKACVDSVLANTKDFRLVLIDDGSTDPAVAEYLKSLEARKLPDVEIKWNAENLGFVKTANRGMRESTSDVVLLNSDTVVTANWLEKMRQCAYSDKSIATVTPLTNNGTICSVPNFIEDNPLPEGINVADMGALVERVSRRSYPRIPTAVGFCVYIKREALENVGYFDEEAFGRGYEEENDWCCRAREAGYAHALDDSTFIYHKGSMSFSDDSAALKEKNARILLERYPHYREVVGAFISENPLRDIQENIRRNIGEGPVCNTEIQEPSSEQNRSNERIWPTIKRITPHPVKWFIKYKILGMPQELAEKKERMLLQASEMKGALVPEPIVGLAGLGVNVSGYFKGEFGVAEAARSDIRILEGAGIPFTLNYLPAPLGHSDLDGSIEMFSRENPYKYNLIHVNADAALNFREGIGKAYFEGKYNIGHWVWELSTFPAKFLNSFSLFDEIWAPSGFCVDSISRVSKIPVVRMPYSIDLGSLEKTNSTRYRFGLREDEFVFLTMFDFYSSYQRKNPAAVLRSFRKAFGKQDKVKLIIKHMNSGVHPAELKAFNEELAGLNVEVLDCHLRKEELHNLFASCDCYVSLHRSEGFGLTIAEAMALGKPVIATAYSGNTDFMDINNSFPVKYNLVELDMDYPPYERGSIWADPDIDHAALLMRLVYEDRELGESIGAIASRTIREKLSPQAVGGFYRDRLEHLESCGHLG